MSIVRRARGAVAENRFAAVLFLLIVLFVYFGIAEERFLSSANIRNLLSSVSILWILSMGVTFVMLSGGFDLSIGSMLALAGILLALFYNGIGMPAALAVLCTIAAGALLGGGLNGFLIGRVGLPFLVVTLGTLTLFRGVVNLVSGTKAEAVVSSLVDTIGFKEFIGIPVPVWIMLVVFLVSLYVLRATYFGRDVYATGGNAEAARVSGIKVDRTWIAVYAISGAAAALGGIIQVGRIGSASPLVGETILFDATAAVLLGGTSFHGGIGGVGGTAIGVLFIGVLQNGLAIAGVSSFWQQVVSGTVLILAVLIDKIQRDGWASLNVSRRRPPSRSPGTPATPAETRRAAS